MNAPELRMHLQQWAAKCHRVYVLLIVKKIRGKDK